MPIFKDPNLKWRLLTRFIALWVIIFFVVFTRQDAYLDGYNTGVKNAYVAPQTEDGTPSNLVSPSVEDEDCYPEALEIICIEDLPDIAGIGDGKRYFKTTVRNKDGTVTMYVNWVNCTKWESTLLSIVKGRFERR